MTTYSDTPQHLFSNWAGEGCGKAKLVFAIVGALASLLGSFAFAYNIVISIMKRIESIIFLSNIDKP